MVIKNISIGPGGVNHQGIKKNQNSIRQPACIAHSALEKMGWVNRDLWLLRKKPRLKISVLGERNNSGCQFALSNE